MNRMIPTISAVISAVLLGVMVMLLAFLLVAPTDQVIPTGEVSPNFRDEVQAAQALGRSDVGAVAFPSSLIYAGLIVVLSLIVAFSASLWIKRRVLQLSA